MNNIYRVCGAITVIVLIGIRSDAQVSQAWAVKYNGAGNGYDYAYAMTIDRSGNTYVTGEAYTGANNDCTTIKYNSNGDTVWVKLYNGPGNSRDIGRAIAVDTAGNVYVTGESIGTTGYDIATIKYDAAGVQLWASRYDGPAHGVDGGTSIAVDAFGNVYVSGYSTGVTSGDDYITIKYNSSGTQQWATRYDGPAGFHDDSYAIAVDNSGNVYVTGRSSGSGTAYDYATVKYNSAGTQQWATRYDDTLSHLNDYAYSIAVDNSGNVYVTGSSQASISHEGYATVKYNSAGTQQWVSRYDGAGGGDDAYALAYDGGNNIFVTGASRNPASPYSFDYLTIRYNVSTGDTVWSARYNGPANGDDYSQSIALDRFGNVFVTGYSTGVGSGFDYATLRYDSLGAQQWVQRYTTPGNNFDMAVSVAVDTLGNIYVAGRGYDAVEFNNYITIKYHDAALPVELTSFSATTYGGYVQIVWNTATEVNNYGFDIERRSVTAGENLLPSTSTAGTSHTWTKVGFVAGSGSSSSTRQYAYADRGISAGRYAYRIKQIDKNGAFVYSAAAEVEVGLAPRILTLGENYPNPFNPSTTIEFSVPQDGRAVLKIIDLLGREVATLFEGEAKSGHYQRVVFDASTFASGVYFSRLEFGGTQQLKKMILMK
jgi:uncharacterized delta-60 repeat protein